MRKAISPIIATILLIVVSLALISIMLSWGSEFVSKNTAAADNTVDADCVGSYVNFISCVYDISEETVTVNIINTGKTDFKQDQNFNVSIIDKDKQVDFSHTNVLDSNALVIGESDYFVITDYNGPSPITVQLRNMYCPLNYWQTKCS